MSAGRPGHPHELATCIASDSSFRPHLGIPGEYIHGPAQNIELMLALYLLFRYLGLDPQGVYGFAEGLH